MLRRIADNIGMDIPASTLVSIDVVARYRETTAATNLSSQILEKLLLEWSNNSDGFASNMDGPTDLAAWLFPKLAPYLHDTP